jgi:hypothetical protein
MTAPRHALVVAGTLGAVLLTGCAGGGSIPGGPTSTASSSASSSASAGSATPSPGPSTARKKAADPAPVEGERMTVQGTVSAQVGACLLFTPGDMATSWVLVGTVAGLAPGDRVEVSGTLGSARLDGCGQGPPFQVLAHRVLR